jgi:ABC-type transporter Mla subunit MlaD
MSTKESSERVNRAISEVAETSLPVAHQVVDVIQKNVEQLSGSSRELLDVVQRNLDPLVQAATRLASSGVQLATDLMQERSTGGENPRPPRPTPTG